MVSSKIILLAVLTVVVTALPHKKVTTTHRVYNEVEQGDNEQNGDKTTRTEPQDTKRISAVSLFAKGISDKSEGARQALDKIAQILETEDRVITIDSGFYSVFSWIAVMEPIGNAWIDGAGTRFKNMYHAFIRMGICHEPIRNRLGIQLNGYVPVLCDKDYGSEWNYREFKCSEHTAEETIKFYKLENIVAEYEELHKKYNNGAEFKDEAEKLIFGAMFSAAQIIGKGPENWDQTDLGILIFQLISSIGVYGSSYKDTNFGNALIDEFSGDYSVLLHLLKMEVDLGAIIDDVKSTYKHVKRNTFNGAFLDVDVFNSKRISAVSLFAKGISDKSEGARQALDKIAQILETEDRVITIDSGFYSVFSWIAVMEPIANAWIDGAGTRFKNMYHAFIRMGICHEPIRNRLGIQLNGYVPVLCEKDYGSEWNYREFKCSEHTAEETIKFYKLENIVAEYEELHKKYNNGAEFKDEAEKLIFGAMFSAAQIIGKGPENWDQTDLGILIFQLISSIGVYGSSYKDTNFGNALIDEFSGDYSVLLHLLKMEVDLGAIIDDVKSTYKHVKRNTFNGAFLDVDVFNSKRVSAVSRFAKGISDKSEGAKIALNKLALIIENEDRVIDINSALYTLFSWIAASGSIGNTWKDGVGTRYEYALHAYIRMALCHEPTSKRLGIEMNGNVPDICNKDYGSEWNFRPYECSKHTAEETIKWFKLEDIIAYFDDLRKKYNNGAGFKDEAEKLIFEAMFSTAKIVGQNPKDWTQEGMGVIITNFITTLGVYGSSYKDPNFGDAILDEFSGDYGVLLFLLNIEVDLEAIIAEVKNSYKNVKRNTFNGAFLEYQDDGFDYDDGEKEVITYEVRRVVKKPAQSRRSVYEQLASRFDEKRSSEAKQAVLNIKQSNKNKSAKDVMTDAVINLSNMVRAITDVCDNRIDGSGELYQNLMVAFFKITLCHTETASHLAPGLPQGATAEVCTVEYDRKWGYKECKDYSSVSAIRDLYEVKDASKHFEKLLKKATNGVGLTKDLEKQAWKCLTDSADIFKKDPKKWTVTEVEVVFKSYLRLIAIIVTAVEGNAEFAVEFVTKYKEDIKPVIDVYGLWDELDVYVSEMSKTLKSSSSKNFEGIWSETSTGEDGEDDQAVAENDVAVKKIKKTIVTTIQSIYKFLANKFNQERCSKARQALLDMKQRQQNESAKRVMTDAVINLSNMVRAITDVCDNRIDGSGELYQNMMVAFFKITLCHTETASHLAPGLPQGATAEVCTVEYDRKWGYKECKDYSSVSAIRDLYEVKDASKQFEKLLKKATNGAGLTKDLEKQAWKCLTDSADIFKKDPKKWTVTEVEVVFKSYLRLIAIIVTSYGNAEFAVEFVTKYKEDIKPVIDVYGLWDELDVYVSEMSKTLKSSSSKNFEGIWSETSTGEDGEDDQAVAENDVAVKKIKKTIVTTIQSIYKFLANKFNQERCSKARQALLDMKQRQQNESAKRVMTDAVINLSNMVRAITDVCDNRIDGSGELYQNMMVAFFKITLCHTETASHLAPGLPQGATAEVCTVEYDRKWGYKDCKDYSSVSAIRDLYEVKDASKQFEKLLKKATNGAGLTKDLEKQAWKCLTDSADIFKKDPKKWTVTEVEVVFKSYLRLIAIIVTSYGNAEFAVEFVTKYKEDIKPVIDVYGLWDELDVYVSEMSKTLKSSSSKNFEGIWSETSTGEDGEDDQAVAENDVAVKKIKKTIVTTIQSIYKFLANKFNQERCSKARQALLDMKQRQQNESAKRVMTDAVINLSNMVRAITDVCDNRIDGSGELYQNMMVAFFKITLCHTETASHLAPGLPQGATAEVCTVEYDRKWGYKECKDYSSVSAIRDLYEVKDASKQFEKLLKKATNGAGLTKDLEKQAWKCLTDSADIFKKDPKKWTVTEVEVVFKSYLRLIAIIVTSYGNAEFAVEFVTKYKEDIKPVIDVYGLWDELDVYVSEMSKTLKSSSSKNFEGIWSETSTGEDGTITKYVVREIKKVSIIEHLAKRFNQKSKASEYFLYIIQKRESKSEIEEVTIAIDRLVAMAIPLSNLCSIWVKESGVKYLNSLIAIFKIVICNKETASRLVPKLPGGVTPAVCTVEYDRRWGWKENLDYSTPAKIIETYEVASALEDLNQILKKQTNGAGLTKDYEKRTWQSLIDTVSLFKKDTKKWTKKDVELVFENFLLILARFTSTYRNEQLGVRIVVEFKKYIDPILELLDIKNKIDEFVKVIGKKLVGSSSDNFAGIWSKTSSSDNNDDVSDEFYVDYDNTDNQHKPVETKDKPKDKTVETKKKPKCKKPVAGKEQPKDKPVETKDKPKDKPVESKKKPKCKRPVAGKDQPKDKPAETKDKPKDKHVETKDKPKEKPVGTKDKPKCKRTVVGKDQPTDKPVETKDKPKEKPVETKEKPNETEKTRKKRHAFEILAKKVKSELAKKYLLKNAQNEKETRTLEESIENYFNGISAIYEILESWIPGSGVCYSNIMTAFMKITMCYKPVSSRFASGLKEGSPKACEKNYGVKEWGFKEYTNSYDSYEQIIEFYEITKIDFQKLLKTHKYEIKSDTEKLVWNALISSTEFYKKDVSKWTKTDVQLIFKNMFIILGGFGTGFQDWELGTYIVEEYIIQISEILRTYNIINEIEAYKSETTALFKSCPQYNFGGATSSEQKSKGSRKVTQSESQNENSNANSNNKDHATEQINSDGSYKKESDSLSAEHAVSQKSAAKNARTEEVKGDGSSRITSEEIQQSASGQSNSGASNQKSEQKQGDKYKSSNVENEHQAESKDQQQSRAAEQVTKKADGSSSHISNQALKSASLNQQNERSAQEFEERNGDNFSKSKNEEQSQSAAKKKATSGANQKEIRNTDGSWNKASAQNEQSASDTLDRSSSVSKLEVREGDSYKKGNKQEDTQYAAKQNANSEATQQEIHDNEGSWKKASRQKNQSASDNSDSSSSASNLEVKEGDRYKKSKKQEEQQSAGQQELSSESTQKEVQNTDGSWKKASGEKQNTASANSDSSFSQSESELREGDKSKKSKSDKQQQSTNQNEVGSQSSKQEIRNSDGSWKKDSAEKSNSASKKSSSGSSADESEIRDGDRVVKTKAEEQRQSASDNNAASSVTNEETANGDGSSSKKSSSFTSSNSIKSSNFNSFFSSSDFDLSDDAFEW